MSAPIRTAHDPEQDVLRGWTLEETRLAATRLEAQALGLTIALTHLHYAESSVVRQNLERERNGLEMEAADLQSRIAEFEGKIEHQREPEKPLSDRAALVRGRV